jgi:PAS domain S-box-containing protein
MSPPKLTLSNLARTTVQDVAVEVIISNHNEISQASQLSTPLQANMIISSWFADNEQYYTLTFTNSSSMYPHSTNRTVVRSSVTSDRNAGSSSSAVSSTGRRPQLTPSSVSSTVIQSFQPPQLLPNGPPLKGDQFGKPSIYQKATQLKDAVLSSIDMPAYAMWKDESFGIPNKALLKLLPDNPSYQYNNNDQREFLSQFTLWNEDFNRELSLEEFPIMQICRTQKPIAKRRIGMKHPTTHSTIIFEVIGEPILHDATGEFLGGLVLFKDITEYRKELALQIQKNENQFEYIANMIPIMVWTTDPAGIHDWYSQRWYDYTGMTVEESFGEGWRNAFHEDDMPATEQRWLHSLRTGDEYLTEYRCRRYDGEWRWMLGRAVPFRDENGKILKFFGTCIDIHELITARQESKARRNQLMQVIEHAKVTLMSINKDRELTLLEGNPIWDDWDAHENMIGQNIYDIVRKTLGEREENNFRVSIERILQESSREEVVELHIESNGRWYRSRLLPLIVKNRKGGIEDDDQIDGVICVSMDVTELHARDLELREQEKENAKLLANAVAAKEASRMKSQFLANVSTSRIASCIASKVPLGNHVEKI